MTLTLTLIYISIYIGLIATTFYILSYKRGKVKKKQLFTDDELPTVSVIIPAFNEEKSIAGTIESIRASDYPKGKLEIIIIDVRIELDDGLIPPPGVGKNRHFVSH